jgi:predicted DNA-binding transcriptional regulator YafY
LLQARPSRTGEELADELGVTLRTLRRDVNRLRDAGFGIEASPGVHGGYRIAAGTRLPPIVLTDAEAVAIAIALRGTAAATVTGLGDDTAHQVLTKLEELLPSRLRGRVAALRETTISMLRTPAVPSDVGRLTLLASACRDCVRVRITYSARPERSTERVVEPYRLVQTSHCWYLVARDPESGDWKTFRVDRMADAQLLNAPFERSDPPDVERLVTEGTAVAPYSRRARLRLPVPAAEALDRVPRSYGLVEPIDDESCHLVVGYEHERWLVHFVSDLPWIVEVIDPPSLGDALGAVGQRLLAAAGSGSSIADDEGRVGPRR